MSRGKFITFEGGEGVGKSTQAKLLADALTKDGRKVELTREPGGTPGAEAIRALLLDPPGDGWGSRAEAMLFAAARADHVERRILPALDEGRWVVCDRFVDSSRAYQGIAGQLGDGSILDLHRIGSGGLLPDMSIVLFAEETSTAERIALRDGDETDAIGGRDRAYHAQVALAFKALSREDPQRFRLIDANRPVELVHHDVMAAIGELTVTEVGKC